MLLATYAGRLPGHAQWATIEQHIAANKPIVVLTAHHVTATASKVLGA